MSGYPKNIQSVRNEDIALCHLILNFQFCLGEEPLSFGYGGTGKFSHDNKFSNYGKPFQVGNVVGAYLVIFFLCSLLIGNVFIVGKFYVHLVSLGCNQSQLKILTLTLKT